MKPNEKPTEQKDILKEPEEHELNFSISDTEDLSDFIERAKLQNKILQKLTENLSIHGNQSNL